MVKDLKVKGRTIHGWCIFLPQQPLSASPTLVCVARTSMQQTTELGHDGWLFLYIHIKSSHINTYQPHFQGHLHQHQHASKVTRMDGWLPSVDLERSCSACHSHPNGHLRQHFVASKKVSSGSSGKRHLLISAWIQGRKKNASCFVAISISCRHCIVLYIHQYNYIH